MSASLSSPQVPQGIINLGRVNLQVVNFPQLNVTASFMGAGGLSFSRNGPATTFINTLTGRVRSPEPFQPVTVTVHLVKSQNLAGLWEAQLQASSLLGTLNIFTDARALPSYQFLEGGYDNVGEIVSNGKSAEYMITLGATYIINNNMWNVVA
jgi:hypothetical protein